MDYFDGLKTAIRTVKDHVDARMPSLTWANVTQVTPTLLILPEHAAAPIEASTGVWGLEVGDRVYFVRSRGRAVVLVKAKGVPVPLPATQAEVDAGTDDTKYVTPKTLAGRGVSYAVTPGAGFSIYDDWPVELIVKDGWAHLHVTLYYSGSGSATSLLSVPVDARPTNTRAIGYSHMSGGESRIHGVLFVNSSGVVGFHSSYNEGSLLAGQYVPVVGSWRVD